MWLTEADLQKMLSLNWTDLIQLYNNFRADYPDHPCAKSCFVRAVSGIHVPDTSRTIFTQFCLTCHVLLLGEATNITQLLIA